MKSIITTLIFLIAIMISSCDQEKKVNENNDILASWTDSKVKKDIIRFVQAVCEKSNKSYVEPADKIAVFDLDGTILCEKPKYTC